MQNLITFLFIFLLFISCSKVPLTGRKQFTPIPHSQMVTLGKSNYTQVLQESKISDNAEYKQMIQEVGERISKAVEVYLRQNNLSERIEGYQWEYNVLEGEQVNAWAMPGGKIAFYEGIMPICQDETGIAVVMGHEVAHLPLLPNFYQHTPLPKRKSNI